MLAGPPARQPWTWVCSPTVPRCRTNTVQQNSCVIFLYVYVFPGTDKYGFGFGGTGKKSNNKQFDSYGEVMFNEIICYFYPETTVKIAFKQFLLSLLFTGVHHA